MDFDGHVAIPFRVAARQSFSWREPGIWFTLILSIMFLFSHDKMRSGADLRGGTPLVSFNPVIGPHFVTGSSSLYAIISNHNPIGLTNPNLTSALTVTIQWTADRP